MKKTLLVLTMLGAGTALMAQEGTTTGSNDGRMAAQDMLNMKPAEVAPIRQTYVPDEVMDRVMSTYGDQLYAVKQVMSGSGEHVYQVTLVNNNQTSVAWVGEAGSEVAYVYRTDDKAIMAGTQSTNNDASATTTEPAENTAPAVDDNTDNQALDNSANTLDEPVAEPETKNLAPEEKTNEPQEQNSTAPKPEATLPQSNNGNTSTSKPDSTK